MNSFLVKLFREGLAGLFRAIVGIVYDDLTTGLEKVPDVFLAAFRDALAECERFKGLLACDRGVGVGDEEQGRVGLPRVK